MHMSDWSSDVCSSDLSAPPPATANLPALTISVATLGALPPDYESITPDLPKARHPSPPALLARLPEILSHLHPRTKVRLVGKVSVITCRYRRLLHHNTKKQ